MHERAKMIVDMEMQHPSWHTFCNFMHVAEAADKDSTPAPDWEGITGRVKQLLELTNARVEQVSSRMAVKEEVATNAEVEALMGKVDEMRVQIEDLTGKVGETRDEMKKVRQLLQLLLDKK